MEEQDTTGLEMTKELIYSSGRFHVTSPFHL